MTVEPWIKDGHCQTESGRAVRIYATDGGPNFPVHGAELTSDGTWSIRQWMEDGRFSPFGGTTSCDLVPIETTKMEVWYFDKYKSSSIGTSQQPLNVTRDHEGRVTKVELAE